MGKEFTLSEEHKAKLYKANKGKRHSPEARAKMSRAKLGRKLSPEHCAKLSAAKLGVGKGRKLSPETRAKLSAAQLINNYNRGRPLKERTRVSISRAVRKRYAEDPAYRVKLSKANKGKKLSANHRDKLSRATAQAMIEGRCSGAYRYGVRTLYQGILFRSKAEANYAAILDAIGIEWKFEPCALSYWDAVGKPRRYVPDFWLSGLGVYIEVGAPTPEKLSKLRAVGSFNPGVTVELVTLSDVHSYTKKYQL